MIEKSNGLQRIQFDRGGCGDSNLLGRLSGMANALIGQNEQPGSYAGCLASITLAGSVKIIVA
jgi:hypothetical protein